MLVLSVHLRRHVQCEIDHEQELQLEAIHLRSWYASHLQRQLLVRTAPVRTHNNFATHRKPSEERNVHATHMNSDLGIIRVVVINIVEELGRHHDAATHNGQPTKWHCTAMALEQRRSSGPTS